ncbi:MAG: hypothetical protein LBN95_03105 [Prevotellaceae bacterium]|jgi:hypothetical protein|nr:hypothetical protein [Prevotellaceae bacterium]
MKKTKISFLMLAVICLILQGCNFYIDDLKDQGPIKWKDDKAISFDPIVLKVSGNYYTTSFHSLVLHPENGQSHAGSIFNDFCNIFTYPDPERIPTSYSKVIAQTTSQEYIESKKYYYSGGDTTKIYTECSNGLKANSLTLYCPTNRDVRYQTIDLTIISGPYENENYATGKLYWEHTITYENQSYSNGIVYVGSWTTDLGAFKIIQNRPFIGVVYTSGAFVERNISMPNLATLNFAAIQ